METFKGSFGDKQFYFKPKDNGETYLVEPYKQLGLKSFKLIKRNAAEIDKESNRAWLIPADESLPPGIRNLELGFSDFIQEKLGLTV